MSDFLHFQEILSSENDALTFDQLLKEVTEAMQAPFAQIGNKKQRTRNVRMTQYWKSKGH